MEARIFPQLQSRTKLVEKNEKFFVHIFFNFPSKENTSGQSQCCFEGQIITKPFFQWETNTDEGEGGGAGLLMHHCSGGICRSKKLFFS